eukprot:416914_1
MLSFHSISAAEAPRKQLTWNCRSCDTTNTSDRNVKPCTKCHILESDTNLKRARELYILGNIENESVRLLPLKTSFFIYPLSAPDVRYNVEYKENQEIFIHFDVELWDDRRIEFYHIEAIKIDVESQSISSTIIQNATPYNNRFTFHFKEFDKSGFQTLFQTFNIYAKCYNSTRVSPKREVTIFLSLPKQTTAITHRKKPLKSASKSNPSNKTTSDPVRWYLMNDAGKLMPTYDGLSKVINEMKIGTQKKVSYKSKTYRIRKVTSTECIQRNIETNKLRQLRTADYKTRNHNDDDSKTNTLSDRLNAMTISKSKGIPSDKDTNRHNALQKSRTNRRKKQQQKRRKNDNHKSNTFVPRCLTYQEAVQLKIGKRVDIRCD